VAFDLGRREDALRLAGRAEEPGRGYADPCRVRLLRESFAVPSTDAASIRDAVRAAARAVGSDDVDAAAAMLLRVARNGFWSDLQPDLGDLLVEASDRLGLDKQDPRPLAIRAFAAPSSCGAAVLELLGHARRDIDPVGLTLLGASACALGHFEAAAGLLTAAIDRLRRQRREALRAQALVLRGWANAHLGRLALARADIRAGRGLAYVTHQPVWVAGAQAVAAALAALRGDAETVRRCAAEAERTALPGGLTRMLDVVRWARSLAALGEGRHDDAFDVLARRPAADVAPLTLERAWLVDGLAEAARHVNRDVSVVRVVLREAEALYRHTPSPRLRIALASARALLAADEQAEALFADGLAHTPVGWPIARARLELAYGTWLRRRRRPTDARVPLRSAHEAFEALDMTPWARRASHELRAAGVKLSTGHAPRGLRLLTPQELEIARLAAVGMSNRAIGQRLHLSHRTVGAHLYRVFPKLGINARGELAAALATASVA
jgi:DNA-binding CsgD family transcriptional regulator